MNNAATQVFNSSNCANKEGQLKVRLVVKKTNKNRLDRGLIHFSDQ